MRDGKKRISKGRRLEIKERAGADQTREWATRAREAKFLSLSLPSLSTLFSRPTRCESCERANERKGERRGKLREYVCMCASLLPMALLSC